MPARQRRRYPKVSSRGQFWVSDPFRIRLRVSGTVESNDYRLKRTIIRLDQEHGGYAISVDPLDLSWTPI